MLKIGDNRNKHILSESIWFLVLFIGFAYMDIFFDIIENPLIEKCLYFLGIVVVYEFYNLFFRWKIVHITLEGVFEEYYMIFRKTPYKVKKILSWQNVKEVQFNKQSRYWKPIPCTVMVVFLNDIRHLDYYHIDSARLFFYDYKYQVYDPRLVECLEEIKKSYSFKILFK